MIFFIVFFILLINFIFLLYYVIKILIYIETDEGDSSWYELFVLMSSQSKINSFGEKVSFISIFDNLLLTDYKVITFMLVLIQLIFGMQFFFPDFQSDYHFLEQVAIHKQQKDKLVLSKMKKFYFLKEKIDFLLIRKLTLTKYLASYDLNLWNYRLYRMTDLKSTEYAKLIYYFNLTAYWKRYQNFVLFQDKFFYNYMRQHAYYLFIERTYNFLLECVSPDRFFSFVDITKLKSSWFKHFNKLSVSSIYFQDFKNTINFFPLNRIYSWNSELPGKSFKFGGLNFEAWAFEDPKVLNAERLFSFSTFRQVALQNLLDYENYRFEQSFNFIVQDFSNKKKGKVILANNRAVDSDDLFDWDFFGFGDFYSSSFVKSRMNLFFLDKLATNFFSNKTQTSFYSLGLLNLFFLFNDNNIFESELKYRQFVNLMYKNLRIRQQFIRNFNYKVYFFFS